MPVDEERARGTRSRRRGAGRQAGGDVAHQVDTTGKTTLGAGVVPLGGGIFKSAAVAVLRQERKLMTTGEITRVALERGLINCQGKTPEATMASALYTDVKRKHNKSVFTRPTEGLFGLREWIDEGFFPEGWPADGEGVGPYKRRGAGVGSRGGGRSGGRGGRRRGSAVWRRNNDSESYDTDDDEGEVQDGGQDEEGSHDLEEPAVSEKPASERRGRGASRPPMMEDEEDEDARPVSSPMTGSRRSRRATAAETVYTNGVPSRRESRDGRYGLGTSSTANHGGMPNLGDLPKDIDDLESPLHVLGDVALSTRESEEAAAAANGYVPVAPLSEGRGRRGSKRDRPSPLQVPAPGIQQDTPKSPFEDSLAALHEIATTGNSPQAFGMTADNHAAMDAEPRSKRPRLQVHVGNGGPDGDMYSYDMPMPSPLLTTGRGLRGREPQQFIHPLPSPANHGYTNDNKLLSIPDIMPSSGGDNPQAGLLFSPTMMQSMHNGSTPRIGGTSADGTALAGDKNPFRPDGFGPQQGYGMLGESVLPYHAGPQAYAPQRHDGTPEDRMCDADGLLYVVQRLEARLGRSNPITAKCWLAVARMYHSLVGALGATAAGKARNALHQAAQLAEEAAASIGCAWHGRPHVDILQRALEQHHHGHGMASTISFPIPHGGFTMQTPGMGMGAGMGIGIPPGTGATTLTTTPAVAALGGGKAPALLSMGPSPVQGPTMQVIPAPLAPQVPNTEALPVLNLDDSSSKPSRLMPTLNLGTPPPLNLAAGGPTSMVQPLNLGAGTPSGPPSGTPLRHLTPLPPPLNLGGHMQPPQGPVISTSVLPMMPPPLQPLQPLQPQFGTAAGMPGLHLQQGQAAGPGTAVLTMGPVRPQDQAQLMSSQQAAGAACAPVLAHA